MEFDIKKRTIFLTLHGSHAYGMATPTSDIDLKGIAIPTRDYFLGFNKKFEQFESNLLLNNFEKTNIEKNINRKILKEEVFDSTIYDIRKFFLLASQCNPNIIEVLYADECFHIIKDPIMKELLDNRDLFLSTRANFRFRGYAFSQLKRIKRHRRWLLFPINKKPERKDFGLPNRTVIPQDQLDAAESLIRKKVDEWVFEQEEMSPELLSDVRNRTIKSFKEYYSTVYSKGNSTLIFPQRESTLITAKQQSIYNEPLTRINYSEIKIIFLKIPHSAKHTSQHIRIRAMIINVFLTKLRELVECFNNQIHNRQQIVLTN